MKYIKTFENKLYYKVGDYVAIDLKTIINPQINLQDQIFAKIIEVDGSSQIPYLLLFSNGFDGWVSKGMIERTLNKDEIEDFELKLNTNKYNL